MKTTLSLGAAGGGSNNAHSSFATVLTVLAVLAVQAVLAEGQGKEGMADLNLEVVEQQEDKEHR